MLKSIIPLRFRRSFSLPPVRRAVVIGLCCLAAQAVPLKYTLQNVAFAGGGTASGSFVFDADVAPACSTAASPCGRYSQVSITTTTGGGVPGTTYSFVCGSDVPTCTGVSPDSTEVLLLASTAANQTGLPGFSLFFLASGIFPPAGLSDAGGTFDISNGAAGSGQEGLCLDAVCTSPDFESPNRATNSGTVANLPPTGTIPTLTGWGMLLFTMLLVGYAAMRMRAVGGTAALVLLALAAAGSVRAADQADSKPKPAPTTPAQPKTDPKANSQKTNPKPNEKDKPNAATGNSNPWRPKH